VNLHHGRQAFRVLFQPACHAIAGVVATEIVIERDRFYGLSGEQHDRFVACAGQRPAVWARAFIVEIEEHLTHYGGRGIAV